MIVKMFISLWYFNNFYNILEIESMSSAVNDSLPEILAQEINTLYKVLRIKSTFKV